MSNKQQSMVTSKEKSATLAATDYKEPQILCALRGGTYGLPLNMRPENTKCYDEKATTLCNGTCAGHKQGVLQMTPISIDLRRLTPTECARLQGMPDWWCDGIEHSDSAEYKMWGNGMALPCVMYVLEGIKEALENEQRTTETRDTEG